jgi:hypothetical protein
MHLYVTVCDDVIWMKTLQKDTCLINYRHIFFTFKQLFILEINVSVNYSNTTALQITCCWCLIIQLLDTAAFEHCGPSERPAGNNNL